MCRISEDLYSDMMIKAENLVRMRMLSNAYR